MAPKHEASIGTEAEACQIADMLARFVNTEAAQFMGLNPVNPQEPVVPYSKGVAWFEVEYLGLTYIVRVAHEDG